MSAGPIAVSASRAPSLAPVLELLKPITWFPPMWAFGCGVASAHRGLGSGWVLMVAGVALCGPLVCGTSQAVNDWFDRHVDAINEPGRPIPSGRLPGRMGLHVAVVWTLLSLLAGAGLGWTALVATVAGLGLAWAYSAPPLRLKQNGWWGNAACAVCYEGLPWVTGAAIKAGHLPGWPVFVAAGLYSLGAHGIMTLNDFKSVEGDATMGIRSLPVQLGVDRAGFVACVMMALPQAAVIVFLVTFGRPIHAAVVAVLLLVQLGLMRRLLSQPRALAPWYNGTGVTLYVIGMLVTAFAVRPGLLP